MSVGSQAEAPGSAKRNGLEDEVSVLKKRPRAPCGKRPAPNTLMNSFTDWLRSAAYGACLVYAIGALAFSCEIADDEDGAELRGLRELVHSTARGGPVLLTQRAMVPIVEAITALRNCALCSAPDSGA
jgi:hypothetical protein